MTLIPRDPIFENVFEYVCSDDLTCVEPEPR